MEEESFNSRSEHYVEYNLTQCVSSISEIASNQERIYVHQGYAEVSDGDTLLQSEGFSQCSALIVQGDTQAYLAHIDDWNLSDQQYKMLGKLPAGDYSLTMVKGSISRLGMESLLAPNVSEFASKFCVGGKVIVKKDEIYVDSGRYHWAVSYNPAQRKLDILLRYQNIIRQYEMS